MKFQPDATPPQFSDSRNESLSRGSAVRCQIIGLRSDVNSMHAIGKMSAEWFGYDFDCYLVALTDCIAVRCEYSQTAVF